MDNTRRKIGIQSLVYSRTFYLDTLPPTGTLRINGDALDTVATKVKLNLNVIESGSGISSVSLSNDGLKYSLPFSITSTIEWDLSRGVGTKIVYAKLLDYAGNQATLSDTIHLVSR